MANEAADRWHELGSFIRQQRALSRLSLRRLSELAGISNPYLSQIERGLRKPSAEILQQIARALQISAETLYVQAGILDRPSDQDLIHHIESDPYLSEEHKQTLIRIYVSFRGERPQAPPRPGPPTAPPASPAAGPDAGTGPAEGRSERPAGPQGAPTHRGAQHKGPREHKTSGL